MDTNQVHDYISRYGSHRHHHKRKLPFTFPVLLPFWLFQFFFSSSSFGSCFGTFQVTCFASRFLNTGAKRVKNKPRLSSLPPSLHVSASSAGVCHPLLSPTDMCLPVYCCWPGRLVGVQAGALSLTLWNTTAVRLLPDSMLIVWFNAPMFNHEEKWREREIMIISSKFFCVGSHLYTFRMRCCL